MKNIAAIIIVLSICLSIMTALAAQITATDKRVTVTDATKEDTLLMALYKNGRILDLKTYSGSGTYSADYAADMADCLGEADEVRAFLWNMQNIEPVCPVFASAINELPFDSPSLTPTPETKEYKIRLTAEGREFTATLYKNSTTDALVEKLPLTLPMMDLYGREMCYRFPDALPTDNAQYTGYEVGEIVYWPPGHSFVIMYAQNGEEFQMQKLGYMDSGVEFFETSGDVEMKIELIP